MVSAALASLLTAAPCLPLTDLCPPEGSTLSNAVGGQTVVTTSKGWRAVGFDFAPGPVRVSVTPWSSSDGRRGALVRVDGALAKRQLVSGVWVEGDVGLAQQQTDAPRAPAILVRGALAEAGQLELPGFPPARLAQGTRVNGHLDLPGPALELESLDPVRVAGLTFGTGKTWLQTRSGAPEATGRLAERQVVGAHEVEGLLRVELLADGGAPRLLDATLAAPAPLSVVAPLEGRLPAGTTFTSAPSQVSVRTDDGVEVAGRLLFGQSTFNSPRLLVVTRPQPGRIGVTGVAADGGIVAVDGVKLQGPVDLQFDEATGALVSASGLLQGMGLAGGFRFAPSTPFTLKRTPELLNGTLAEPQRVADLWARGEVLIESADGGSVATIATLARPFAFEGWTLPAQTTLQRGAWGWTFTTPKTGPARLAVGSPRDIDFVQEARSDVQGLSFTVVKPWRPKGAPFSFSGFVAVSPTGCIEGEAPRAVVGLFTLPPNGSLKWCSGRVAQAQGDFAVPTLKVGRWYATHAVEGDPGDPPPPREELSRLVSRETPPSGYWIQVNRACRRPSGIPNPTPVNLERWVFLDGQGEPGSAEDRELLERVATQPGKPCPAVRCCVP